MAIPRIDLSGLLSGEAEAPVVAEIARAWDDIGFMTVVNHGVDLDLVRRMYGQAQAFFALPEEVKLSLAPQQWNAASGRTYRGYFPASANGKEGLDLASPTLTPEHPFVAGGVPLHEPNEYPPAELLPEFAATVAEYYEAMRQLGLALMRAAALALGVDADRFATSFDDPMATLRLNFYPGLAVEVGEGGVALACETHTDGSVLTLLLTDEVSGLQVQAPQSGEWIDVPYIPDAFVVNTGVGLQTLSGGRWTATNHRVLLPPRQRISLPFFLEARHDVSMAAVVPGPAPSREWTYLEYITESNKRFKEYRRGEDGDAGVAVEVVSS